MADDGVEVGFALFEGGEHGLFAFGEVEGWEDAGFGRGRLAVSGGEQVFELAEDVLGTFAEAGALSDEFMAALAAG